MTSNRFPYSQPTVALVLAALILTSAVGVIVSTAQDLHLEPAADASHLTEEESAYYEYVVPRLDRLVTEVDDVVEMVDEKSRDIIALTISGSRIEELTGEIVAFGESQGVPDRFADIHETILEATDTATYTFDQARKALRSFDFSRMTGLVAEFKAAASGLHEAQDALTAFSGGTGGA